MPSRSYHFYCCWGCRVAHVGEAYEDRRGWQRERNQYYDRGYSDGMRGRPAIFPLSLRHWKFMVSQLHPDRFEYQPEAQVLATEVLKWLTARRPEAPDERRK
jgi:hypothetical protein